MKGMKKRGLCLALSLYIVAGSATNSYASASVVIGGGVAVGVEYAFAWLLGAVGLTAASVAVYENADSIKAWGAQQNREFCQWVQANADAYNEWADVTEDKINDWCDDLAKGTIRKGSSVWNAFKAWASSIYVRGGTLVPAPAVGTATYVAPHSFLINDSKYSYFVNTSDYPMWVCWLGESYMGTKVNQRAVALSTGKITFRDCVFSTNSEGSFNGSRLSFSSGITVDGYYYLVGDVYDTLRFVTGGAIAHYSDYTSDYLKVIGVDRGFDITTDVSGEDEYTYVGGASNVFDRDGSLDNVDLVGVGSDADAKDIPVVWPGNDALVDILAALAAGAESWSQVLEDAGVVPVDRAGDTVVDDEGVTDEPIAGVIPPLPPSVPSELKDYTVDGLSDLFPFCLPFDLIDFLGVLAADPEAPCFTWTFYYPSLDGMKSYDFEIDLSPFNSVAQLLRDMECILFVVGLILITRDQMIKG